MTYNPNLCREQNTQCPTVSVITTATAPFAVPTTPIGKAPIPIPENATSIPPGSTIIRITGATLLTRPEINSGGIKYNKNNGQFTVPLTGRYIITAFLSFAGLIANAMGVGILSIGDIRDVYIYRVHSATGIISLLAADSRDTVSHGPLRVTVTVTTNLNAGDHIFFAVSQNTGATINIFSTSDPANLFSITRIC